MLDRLLAGDEGRAEVLEEEDRYKAVGINGVPSFFLNGQTTFSSAVAAPLLADAIQLLLVALLLADGDHAADQIQIGRPRPHNLRSACSCMSSEDDHRVHPRANWPFSDPPEQLTDLVGPKVDGLPDFLGIVPGCDAALGLVPGPESGPMPHGGISGPPALARPIPAPCPRRRRRGWRECVGGASVVLARAWMTPPAGPPTRASFASCAPPAIFPTFETAFSIEYSENSRCYAKRADAGRGI
jgi:hypothetical protein